AEQEDVARHRLDGPVLVDRAHEQLVGLEHDPVVAGLGDGAAGGQRGQAGARAGTDLAVDPVDVQPGAPRTPAGADAPAHHVDDLVERGPGQVAVRPGPPQEGVEVVEPVPLVADGGDLGHDLLGQDV